jgi:biotin operon repressor
MKRARVIQSLQKKLQIRRETVWKVVKKFKETGETIDLVKEGNEVPEQSNWSKTRGRS